MKTLNGEIDALTVEMNNNSVKIVFGRKYPVKMQFNGEQTTVEDFIITEEFENLVNEGAENYGALCGGLFDKNNKENPVNNGELVEICKNIGISKTIFWKVLWKAIKIAYKENQKELVQKRMEFLRKEEEKEKKVGEK